MKVLIKVLVVWGSKMGGTEEIATMIAEELERSGFQVTRSPAITAPSPRDFDAVIVGGALYSNRWHPEARRFVCEHLEALRGRPVWMFSSGPLDHSARTAEIPPPSQLAVLMDRVGAQGHVTFGGRLSLAHATSGMAAAMARRQSGDWRDPQRVRGWAREVAQALPTAKPRPAIDPPGRRLPRLVGYGALGWIASASLGGAWLSTRSAPGWIAVALGFAAAAYLYFRPGRTREPLPTAAGFAAVAAVLSLAAAAVRGGSGGALVAALRDPLGFWLPLAIGFGVTWLVGALVLSIPSGRPAAQPRPAERAG